MRGCRDGGVVVRDRLGGGQAALRGSKLHLRLEDMFIVPTPIRLPSVISRPAEWLCVALSPNLSLCARLGSLAKSCLVFFFLDSVCREGRVLLTW